MTDLSKYDDERDKLNEDPVDALFELFSVSSDKYAAALMYAAVLGSKSGMVDRDDMQLIIKTYEDARLALMPLLLILIGAISVSVESGEVCVGLIGEDYEESLRQLKRHGLDKDQRYDSLMHRLAEQNELKLTVSRPIAPKSAMNLLPANVRDKILSGVSTTLRRDLRIIPSAEANGWTVSFQGDNWHSSVKLSKSNVRIWESARGWRRALLVNDEYTNHTVHADIETALNYKPETKAQDDNT